MPTLDEIVQAIDAQQQPPLDSWNPKTTGQIDIVIDNQGNWFHEGEPILRFELVKLFASILWVETGQIFLKTPLEKLRIQVADVPFIASQTQFLDAHWLVTTNIGDQVVVSKPNPVELRPYDGVWLPYVLIRAGLWARVSRSVYLQWVEHDLAQLDGGDEVWLDSGDYRFMAAKS